MWIPGVGRLMAVFWCHPKISQCTSQVVLVVKNLPASAGDIRCEFHPWVRKIPWSRKRQPILVYLLGESHRGTWWATVHGVAKSWNMTAHREDMDPRGGQVDGSFLVPPKNLTVPLS